MVSSSHHDSFELKARKGLASWALATLVNLTIDGRPAGVLLQNWGGGERGFVAEISKHHNFLF